ncbi:MAG: alpha/beta hydrolase-fold protein [Hyphomonadaceae bacterium]|nr:alpha/beta hydrolase-fold protein [Hyphomonadaceae bacterium]
MRFLFMIALWGAMASLSTQAVAEQTPVTLANTETFSISSEIVGDEFFIKIAYPRDYAQTDKRYPVLYVTDAETNFGALQYVAQRLAKDQLIPELILVGIAYDTSYKEFYRLRSRDLRPSIPDEPELDLGGRPDEGKAEKFADFLRRELIPAIDEQYRTIEGDRAYYGHSYGGLFGVWSLMYETDLFNRYVILSPSLWWGELWWGSPRISHGYHILPERAATHGTPELEARVFVASGELEPRIDELQEKWATAIRPMLDPSVKMRDLIYEDETHRTIFGRGIMDGLRFVFADE